MTIVLPTINSFVLLGAAENVAHEFDYEPGFVPTLLGFPKC